LYSLVVLYETNVLSLISQRLDNYYQIQTKCYSDATVNFDTPNLRANTAVGTKQQVGLDRSVRHRFAAYLPAMSRNISLFVWRRRISESRRAPARCIRCASSERRIWCMIYTYSCVHSGGRLYENLMDASKKLPDGSRDWKLETAIISKKKVRNGYIYW
jgi:hypothetical protein